MSSISGNIVDVNVLAEYLELTPRRIQQFVTDLGAPRLERGEYDFVQFVKWYITHLRNENEKLKMGDETLYKLEQEDKKVVTAFRKIKLMKELKKVVDMDLVNDAYAKDMIAFKSEIENFRAYANVSLGLSDEQKTNTNKKIDEILTRLGTELRLEEESDEDIIEESIEEETES